LINAEVVRVSIGLKCLKIGTFGSFMSLGFYTLHLSHADKATDGRTEHRAR